MCRMLYLLALRLSKPSWLESGGVCSALVRGCHSRRQGLRQLEGTSFGYGQESLRIRLWLPLLSPRILTLRLTCGQCLAHRFWGLYKSQPYVLVCHCRSFVDLVIKLPYRTQTHIDNMMTRHEPSLSEDQPGNLDLRLSDIEKKADLNPTVSHAPGEVETVQPTGHGEYKRTFTKRQIHVSSGLGIKYDC